MKTSINIFIIIFFLYFVQSSKEIKNIYCENVKNVQEATDCFNTLLDEDYETCCFFEFKNKNKYVRERYCMPLELPQFLNISDIIKDIACQYLAFVEKKDFLPFGIIFAIFVELLKMVICNHITYY